MPLDKSLWLPIISRKRWEGFRTDHPGVSAFISLQHFITAQQSELYASLKEHERVALGRLLARGVRVEIEIFLRTHGANPLFDPDNDFDTPLDVVFPDQVLLSNPVSDDAYESILDGHLIHVLFQAGEASRFAKGPLYSLSPMKLAEEISGDVELDDLRRQIESLRKSTHPDVYDFLVHGELGPKQVVMLRAALRRAASEYAARHGKNADELYKSAVGKQKILFFVSQNNGVNEVHDQLLRKRHSFYGFNPANIVSIEQEVVPGIHVDQDGHIFLLRDSWGTDAAGHLYAFHQSVRMGGFTTYTESGRPIKPMEQDALGYLMASGGEILNVIRINDLDRHTTEIINAKAISYALESFSGGIINVIEGVSNPTGQKGGVAVTLNNETSHVLTETHENSFPVYSRAFDHALLRFSEKYVGRKPAYNAMRQLAKCAETRQVLREYGGRIVFVPRTKQIGNETKWYVSVDMPMGDLSLLGAAYPSRMFQFLGRESKELCIHDMKQIEHLSLYLKTVLHQLKDPFILEACEEVLHGKFKSIRSMKNDSSLYAAPSPELGL